MFEKYSGDLGGLSSAIVNNVTAFYSFLKASRDATQSMKLWGSDTYSIEARKDDILTIIFNCLLMAIHGRLALEGLVPRRSMRGQKDYTERNARLFYMRALFNTIELQCFVCLHAALALDDPRRTTLADREKFYRGLMRLENYKLDELRIMMGF